MIPHSPIKKWQVLSYSSRQRMANRLYVQCQGFIRAGMRTYHLTEPQTRDVYHDSLADVCAQLKRGQFRGSCSLSSYLYQVFHNRCIKALRDMKSQKRDQHTVPILEHHLITREPFRQVEDVDTLAILMQKSQHLHPQLWKILEAKHLHGYSNHEIAQQLGFPTAACVASTKWRYLKQLQQFCNASIY